MDVRMFRHLLGGVALAAALVAAAPVRADEAPLTLEEALKAGLESNPTIASARASLAAAGFGIDAARTGFMPQVTAAVGYKRGTQNSAASPQAGSSVGGLPTGLGARTSTASYDNYSATLALQQTIWDFGRTLGPYDAARAQDRAAVAELRTTVEDTLLQIGRAYFQVIAARESVVAAEEAKRQMTEHLGAARGRVEAGIRPRIDATRAESDLASADLALVQARNARRTSWVALVTAMGRPELPERLLARPPAFQSEVSPDVEQAVQEALMNRPERVQLAEQVRAARAQVVAAKGGYFPSLGANAGLTYTGYKLPDLAWNWYVGASLTWGLVSGIVQANALANQAEANVVALKASLDGLDQSIRAEVENAEAALNEAQEKQAPAQALLASARETADLAEARYAVGSGNVTEVADAQATLVTARTSVIQAELDLETARLGLLRAVGRLAKAFSLVATGR